MTDTHTSSRLSQTWLGLWAALWLGSFGIFVLFLRPAGFGLYGTSWVSGLYWLFMTGAVGYYLGRDHINLGSWPGWKAFSVLTGTLTAMVVVGVWLNRHWPVPAEVWARYRELEIGIVRQDHIYFLAKLPELAFQQMMIYILVKSLVDSGYQGWKMIGTFALVFASIHLPIVAFKGLVGFLYVAASSSAALIFPPLIAYLRGGMLYSFSVHLGAYIAMGIYLRTSGV